MTHKFTIGTNVYYEPTFGNAAARGKYKVVRQLPVENDNRLSYRIKSLAENPSSASPRNTSSAAPTDVRAFARRLPPAPQTA